MTFTLAYLCWHYQAGRGGGGMKGALQ